MPKIKMPARSFYDRTHDVKGDIELGKMYPVMHEEVYPGDTFSDTSELLIRVSPMIRPIMHEINAYLRFFFVRNWTISDNFDEMITRGPNGTSEETNPMNGANYTVDEGSVWDWLNVNPGVYDKDQFNLLPLRAYNKVYNDWYRPQNQVPDEISLDSTAMQYTTWERDYFTSALPFTQRGPEVFMPLGTTAPVVGNGQDVFAIGKTSGAKNALRIANASGNQPLGSIYAPVNIDPTYTDQELFRFSTNASETGLKVDMSSVSGISINDWRMYLQVQAWQELNALGGVRYPESVLAHFGVVTPDARVERAEYLGSMKVPLRISEVLQTSSTDTESPQGNLAGHGIGADRRNIFKRSFTEHGWIIAILTVVPKSGYNQGIPLEYQRKSALDYMWPLFTRLGMREIPIKTLYTGAYLKDGAVVSPDTTGAVWTPVSDPDETFAYNTIYDELRYKSNTVHGKFRSNMAFWHLNRIFATKPTLSQTFVECHPDTDRVLEVTTEGFGQIQIVHRLKCYRQLPKNPTPWHF